MAHPDMGAKERKKIIRVMKRLVINVPVARIPVLCPYVNTKLLGGQANRKAKSGKRVTTRGKFKKTI